MRVVWQLKNTTVRGVYAELSKRRRIAYTTVMTMMNVLVRKGHLYKKRQARAFMYRASMRQDQVIACMVQDFIQRVFGGSVRELFGYLPCEQYLRRAAGGEGRSHGGAEVRVSITNLTHETKRRGTEK